MDSTLGDFHLCPDVFGRLLVVAFSPGDITRFREGGEIHYRRSMFVTAARLKPLRHLVEQSARPPIPPSNCCELGGSGQGSGSDDGVTSDQSSEASPEDIEGLENWEEGEALPNPDPPALTAYLKASEVASHFAVEYGGPFKVERSTVMGLRAIHVACDPTGTPDQTIGPYMLLVGDYATPEGGDTVHHRPLGAPYSHDAVDKIAPPPRPSAEVVNTGRNMSLSESWDWSTRGRMSCVGVGAHIIAERQDGEGLDVVRVFADAEHLYLVTWTEVTVYSL
jgi:hypothetical protein